MSIQYYIVAIIVACIVIIQFISFFKNITIINKLKELFPSIAKLALNEENNSKKYQ